MILEACSSVDEVCARLTCKRLYYLPGRGRAEIISLVSIPLIMPRRLPCGAVGFTDGANQGSQPLSFEQLEDRRTCSGLVMRHTIKRCCYAARAVICQHGNKWECICSADDRMTDTPLWKRLGGWMRAGLRTTYGEPNWRFCRRCMCFTVRKRGHGGSCYHGKAKPRRKKSVLWTVRRNSKRRIIRDTLDVVATSNMRRHLRGDRARKRRGTKRYNLRSSPRQRTSLDI